MAELPLQVIQFIQVASNALALRPELLIFPNVIGAVILPMIFNTLMVKIIANKVTRINLASWVVGVVTAYLTLPFGSIMMYISVAVIAFTRPWNIMLRIFLAGALLAFLIVGLPYITELLARGVVRI